MIEPFGNAIISYVIFPFCKQCFEDVLHNLVKKRNKFMFFQYVHLLLLTFIYGY
jgi:hypothetical protein